MSSTLIGRCPECDGEGATLVHEECSSPTDERIRCEACDGSSEFWPDEEEPRNGLEGSWDFDVTHKGDVYKCRVNDERIEIAAPSGMTMDAKWTGKGLDHLCVNEGEIADEEIPDIVLDEAESWMRSMAEQVPP